MLVTSLLSSTPVLSWDRISDGLDLRCEQTVGEQLSCNYRPLLGGRVNNVTATAAKTDLPVSLNTSFPDESVSIFFLVDTSDPGRQNVIDKNVVQIQEIVSSTTGNYKLGIAAFDKKLKILAPLGSSNSTISTALTGLKAEGRTTELYRSLLLTIEKLSRTASSRKIIYLFSDGQAEDKAYFHNDVVKAARKKGVVINSVGFPRSVSLSVALQTLRRLSEETGGTFTESDEAFNLPGRFYREVFKNVNTGGEFTVDLSALGNVLTRPTTNVKLQFSSDIGDINFRVPVTIAGTAVRSPIQRPVQNQAPTPSPAPAPVAQGQPEIRIISPTTEPEQVNFWLWYGLPIAIVLLFIISLITLILTYRKQPSKDSFVSGVPQQTKPFAYLVTQEEKSKRYPILNTTWRIGRSRDNELVLDDNSVSRLHAEIHRYNNGNFFILDMKSLNGVFVNDEQVTNKKIEEGDIIEIGDIFLRFTQFSDDYPLEDDTAMQITKTPVH